MERHPRLPDEVWYRLTTRRKPVAAEVAATDPTRRAWVMVYPPEGEMYHIFYVEIDRDDVDRVSDTWDYGNVDLHNIKNLYVQGQEQLVVALQEWTTDLSRFGDPQIARFPL